MLTLAWTGEGDQDYAEFGYSVASAGDVNGDGYDDVVVGARAAGDGQVYEGRAYLYLGSVAGLGAAPAWTAESDQADAYFGNSVAAAGDVNGDGYADVLVGASHWDNSQVDAGRAYLYLGSAAGLASTASWTAESDQFGGGFGDSVASAGDVNGDGYDDVVVGEDGYENGQTHEGRALLYLGSADGLQGTASWTAESDLTLASFGVSVASAGDVNQDGFDDVLVGAPGYDNGQAGVGRTYLYLGSAAGLSATAVWIADSDQEYGYFGASLASAGDVNGDGHSDVVVGAYHYENGQLDEGRGYVFLGSADGLETTAAWRVESDLIGAFFGWSVASAGDVNGDGYSDVVVGAYHYDNGESHEGRAYVYLGSAAGLDTTAAWKAESDQINGYFGHSVASAGDTNGDGYADVVVGATWYDNDQLNEGRAFLYLGGCDSDGDGCCDDAQPCDSGTAPPGDTSAPADTDEPPNDDGVGAGADSEEPAGCGCDNSAAIAPLGLGLAALFVRRRGSPPAAR
jgi:hypothetical protein